MAFLLGEMSVRGRVSTIDTQESGDRQNSAKRGKSSMGGMLRKSFFAPVAGLALMATQLQAQLNLNVTSYGAVGDAVQFLVNTTSNSATATTSTALPSSAIGESIEITGAGPSTTPPNNQDFIGTIANLDQTGTIITLSTTAQQNLANAFATYGHNNAPNFMSAIAAVGNQTANITIPAGNFLILTANYGNPYGYAGFVVSQGGINFIGAGTNSTTLLGEGAWFLANGAAERGPLVEAYEANPVNKNLPLTFSYLTMDGGVLNGNTANHGFPASVITGNGWDETHDAFIMEGGTGNNSLVYTYFTNVLVAHWRGEEFKSVDGPTNAYLTIVNSRFTDGNATALNIYPSWNVISNTFDNLDQIAEFYQEWSGHPGYFSYNTCTNITGNSFAINGATGVNPPFNMIGNTMTFATGWNGIETVPAANVNIVSNILINQNFATTFAIGAAGYQGYWDNSNIVISANTIINPDLICSLSGGSPVDANLTQNLYFYNNTVIPVNNNNYTVVVEYGGYTTNVYFLNNNFQGGQVHFSSGGNGGQYVVVGLNNNYYTGISDTTGVTNGISYANGSRFQITGAKPKTAYYLNDINPPQFPKGTPNGIQIPAGAQMEIQNENSSLITVPIYPTSSLKRGPVMLPYGASITFDWETNTLRWATVPPLPVSLRATGGSE